MRFSTDFRDTFTSCDLVKDKPAISKQVLFVHMAELTMGHDLRCLFSKRINQLLEKCVSTSIVSIRRLNFSAFSSKQFVPIDHLLFFLLTFIPVLLPVINQTLSVSGSIISCPKGFLFIS